ncbi:MAG TPA: FAD-binding protein [Gemmatimonadaceae bacterium]|nr:FAD-binding protein [Gemmatimonadaceae bacterium]
MSLNEIRELVVAAREARTPLRVSGRSTWIGAGRPVKAERIATVAAHTGVVDYIPGDLTITVKAGTSLREISELTAKHGQHFPLDPHGSSEGTIGATIATGSSGPMSHGFGAVRDLILGVEFVSGHGDVVRGGGRVVKNVAGFDLVRLMTGSWGTLGIVTEATLRLYSLPAKRTAVAISIPDNRQVGARVAAVLDAPVLPYAVELLDAAMARHCGLDARTTILVDLGGNRAAVDSQRDSLMLGGTEDVSQNVWQSLRTADGESTAVVRISALPGRIAELWGNTARVLGKIDGAMAHARAGLGMVRCIIPQAHATEDLLQRLSQATSGSTVIYERLPAAIWDRISPSIVGDRLSQRVKHAFDPLNILNPGIMGSVS